MHTSNNTLKPKIRLEVSPYANIGKRKVIQRTKATGPNGTPLIVGKDKNNNPIFQAEESDVDNLVMVPGTQQQLCASPTTRGLATGLNKMVDNPYCDLDESEFNPEWGARKLKGKKTVLLQYLLEYEHDVQEGYYRADFNPLVGESYDNIDAPFFAKPQSKVIVSNNTIFLDLNKPEDEVKYYMLCARQDVANSLKELEEDPGRYKYVLTSDGEKDTSKAQTEKLLSRATTYLVALDDLNDETICDMAKVLGSSVNVSRDQAFIFIKRYFEDTTPKLKEFTAWYARYKDVATRNEFIMSARLAEYVDANIIRRRDNSYFWDLINEETGAMENFTWTSREHIVKAFLCNPEFQKEVEVVKAKYNHYVKSHNSSDYKY